MDISHNPRWRRWTCAWALLGVPPSCVLLTVWGPSPTVLTGALAFVVAATVTGVARCSVEPAHRTRHPLLTGAGVGAASATISLSMIGIATVSLPLALLLLLTLAVTCPPVLEQARRRSDARAAAADPDESILMDQPLLRTLLAPSADEMTDTQLCRAWRQSFLGPQDARTVAHRARVVALRCSYLDAFESRHPAAFNAWIAAGARAAGGPDRYLARDRRGPERPS